MKIGELSRSTGVSVRSLRYYEEQGLLAPTRTPGGQRVFPDAAVDRVILIQQLFAAGLHSDRIGQILPCMRAPEGGPSARATPKLARVLVEERERIDTTIADLVRSRAVLDEIIASASDLGRN
ncbi:DNA-binding transcriptional MerR regulator [Haloactinopolyspora alba]|uniref:DNA-binding transcriptional MerR regulator n=1 Tax=Haloactinopolyspora alba TaxID=648780 RepID=A0A2P8D5E1_9ACTN|nr:MerR family transcriptional regulator [Haloactinopolyspora alba]PSK92412.1 DNA-binding transcriptional MerR regulator [Haloactinopolyspora alba]